ncbi:type VI secretion ATPase, ClpV1 family [Salmonella enterica subsp. arizonae]|uniref:Type VI secretion ATPase, ClpV1 family n=1 Tax=Salmonella enterica subsp. arizonae TaxID=59203 RepID=A0A379T2B6_SALER|nr:type VI secretion ATPase, ClpV1 family [Salmonella enterica subsp. arizonae]
MLARRYEWDIDALWQDLLGWLDSLPRSVRSRPQLSDSIQTLMQEAWLIASLNSEEQIRSHHLLMALVGKQNLVRCDGLWPLLTLGQSQLGVCDHCSMCSQMSVRKCNWRRNWRRATVERWCLLAALQVQNLKTVS